MIKIYCIIAILFVLSISMGCIATDHVTTTSCDNEGDLGVPVDKYRVYENDILPRTSGILYMVEYKYPNGHYTLRKVDIDTWYAINLTPSHL